MAKGKGPGGPVIYPREPQEAPYLVKFSWFYPEAVPVGGLGLDLYLDTNEPIRQHVGDDGRLAYETILNEPGQHQFEVRNPTNRKRFGPYTFELKDKKRPEPPDKGRKVFVEPDPDPRGDGGYRVTFRASTKPRSEGGDPVTGVVIQVGGKELSATNDKGEVKTDVEVPPEEGWEYSVPYSTKSYNNEESRGILRLFRYRR